MMHLAIQRHLDTFQERDCRPINQREGLIFLEFIFQTLDKRQNLILTLAPLAYLEMTTLPMPPSF